MTLLSPVLNNKKFPFLFLLLLFMVDKIEGYFYSLL